MTATAPRRRRCRRPGTPTGWSRELEPEDRQVGLADPRQLDLPDPLRSAFGLKYLDITRGDGPEAPQGFTFNGTNDNDDPADDDNEILSIDEVAKNQGADDGTFIAQTEFDEIGNTFDQATRNAIRQNLVGYGGGFTGRGASLNQAFEALNPLLTNLLPVAQTLNDRRTNLAGFFPALARTAAIVAPVAEQNAELFGNAATTLRPRSVPIRLRFRRRSPGGPPTLQTGIDVLPGQRPFLRDTAELASRLRPGVQATAARAAEPQRRDQGRDAGARPQRRHEPAARRASSRSSRTWSSSRRRRARWSGFRTCSAAPSRSPSTSCPAQTVCNYWNYLWTLLPEHLTEKDSIGYSQRVSLVAEPAGQPDVRPRPRRHGPVPPIATTVPGEAETGYSAAGYSGVQANGKYGPAAPPGHTFEQFDPHELPILHANAAGPTGQNGSDCQPGQTGYVQGKLQVAGQSDQNPAVDRSRPSRRPGRHRRLLEPRRHPGAARHAGRRRGSHEGQRAQADAQLGDRARPRRRARDRLVPRVHQERALGRRRPR